MSFRNDDRIAKFVGYFIIAFSVLTILFAAILLYSSRARAQDSERGFLRWERQQRYYQYRDSNPRIRKSRRYYKAIEETSFSAQRCFGRIFTDKGREFSSEETALKDAERSWGALVREEPGEKWMDLKYARAYESRCQRSSTGESVASKVTESITGGSYGLLYRCRIWAEPCTAPRQDGDRNEK